jgi:ribosomal protein L25 (general stress protein Ctc)
MNTEYILEAKTRDKAWALRLLRKLEEINGIPAVVYGDIDNNRI